MKASKKIAAAAAAVGTSVAAGLAVKKAVDIKNNRKEMKLAEENGKRQAYLIGSGLGALATAFYMIRDGKMEGSTIHMLDSAKQERFHNVKKGFFCYEKGMLYESAHENFWDLFSHIPSLEMPSMSVTEEIMNFNHLHPIHAQARLIDGEGKRKHGKNMKFHRDERAALRKLMKTEEDVLQELTIEDWFYDMPHFFQSDFWFLWQTAFSFRKSSSLIEFKRSLYRMTKKLSRMDTMGGAIQMPYHRNESIIAPLQVYLKEQGVIFHADCQAVDLDFTQDGMQIQTIHVHYNGKNKKIHLREEDLCILTDEYWMEGAALGDYKHPASYSSHPVASLWRNIASKKTGLGNPDVFFRDPQRTEQLHFTITCKGNRLLKRMEQFSTNIPGSGGLMSFQDSSWLLSIVIPAQPYVKDQDMSTTIVYGYGMYTQKNGDYVNKPLRECNGEEILKELLYHLHILEEEKDIKKDVINIIPCRIPFAGAFLQPRKYEDRPAVLPEGSRNFAIVSSFAEISDDVAFTDEYLVRAARIAAYGLLGVDQPICPAVLHDTWLSMFIKVFKSVLH